MSDYVTEALGGTLVSMLGELPLEKIGVDALTSRAGIGRATYFRNYTSKEDILADYVALLFRRYIKTLDPTKYAHDLRYRLCGYLAFCRSVQDVCNVIVKAGYEGCILRAYESILHDSDYNRPNDITYPNAFLAYGLYGIFLRWVKSGWRETPEELTDVIMTSIYSETEQQV